MADVLGILGGAPEALQGISLPQVNQGNIYVEESLTPGPGACFPLGLPAFTGVLFRRFLPMLCRLVLASSSSSLHLFPSPVVLCRHTPYRSLPLCNCCPCRVTFLCHGRFRLIWLFRPVPLYPSFIVSLFSPSTISRLTPGYCSFFHCKCLTSPPFLLYYFYDLTSHRGRPYD